MRYQEDEESLIVAINLHGNPRTFDADLSAMEIPGGATTPQDVITGQVLADITDANKNAYQMTLSAYDYAILAVNLQPPAPDPNAIDGVDVPDSFNAAEVVATQDNATGLGDNISELNQLFVHYDVDGFRIGVTGNLATDGTGFAILFDTVSGGQNILDFNGLTPPPAGPEQLTGLRLDSGFTPDHMIYANTYSGNIYVDQYVLPTAGSATKTYRGQGTVNDGDGLLSGGNNPNGLQVAMNNTNSLGVTDTDASAAATALHGFELFVPYADIDLAGTGETIGIAAFIMRSSGDVSNQWLPGLGGGQSNPGIAPNMTTVPGDQFAVVSAQVPGDLDADSDVDFVDLNLFVGVLLGTNLDAQHIARADLDLSGTPNGNDIQLFVTAMLQ